MEMLKPVAQKSQLFLQLIASKWTICIMYELYDCTRRYHELSEALAVTQKSLTVALRKMERDGLIARIVYPVVPPHVEYRLTPLGEKMLAVVKTLGSWFEAHGEEIDISRAAYDANKSQKPFWMEPKS